MERAFKSAGFSGWVTTGCSANGVGTLVRDAAHSTDGFTTLDLRLDRFSVGGQAPPAGKFLRLEVRPNVAPPPQPLLAGKRVSFSGPVLIDMDLQGGGLLLIGTSGVSAGWPEVHPTSITVVP